MKLIYSKENLNGCLRNGLQILRRAKKGFYLECNIQRVRMMHSFQRKKVKMEIIAASMRETNLTYPNIFLETFKQSMYAK